MDWFTEEIWRITDIKQVVFTLRRNVILFQRDLMITGSEFHTIIDGGNCGLATRIKA